MISKQKINCNKLNPIYLFFSLFHFKNVSDHCFTFCQLNFLKKLKILLKILDSDQPEEAFTKFWDIFSSLFDLHFPLKSTSLNKNYHRSQKNYLYKSHLVDRSDLNLLLYKNYRNRVLVL